MRVNLRGVKANWFKVRLNKEEDRTSLHSPPRTVHLCITRKLHPRVYIQLNLFKQH